MRNASLACALLALAFTASAASAAPHSGFDVSVLVNDHPRPEYQARGTVYVEALRGSSYEIRLTNPMPYRVAVALSVDGLNTIDARHTEAWSARKWVLEPYESAVISGWQVDQQTARRFFFTGERRSYGAALGMTDNLGVIEAVFYRERPPAVSQYDGPWKGSPSAPTARDKSGAAPKRDEGAAAEASPQLSDDYAATGMGRRTSHEVQMVSIDLERQPAASIRIRYEFHPQLVRLGVLPAHPAPLERREQASGFERYCPEP